MTDPIRAALERLVTAYDTNEGLLIEEWLQIARTALAQPAPPAEGEVSDEELDDITDETPWRGSPRHFGREVARAAIALDRSRRASVQAAEITEDQREAVKTAVADAIGLFAYDCTRSWEAWSVGTMGQDDFVLIVEDDARVTEIADAAIAALLHPPQPAEGEVGELVEWLRAYRDEEFGPLSDHPDVNRLTRTADLLEQRHPAPVPVAERLPGPEDRNKNGECWWFNRAGVAEWQLSSGGPYGDFWLPAHALPLPAGEVQP